MTLIEDKKAAGAISLACKKSVSLYAAHSFRGDDEFFSKMLVLEDEFVGRLQKRPLSSLDADAATSDYLKRFQKLCLTKSKAMSASRTSPSRR